jgi:DnaJ-related protein SCJ1
MFTQVQSTCNTCHGKGKTIAKACPHCRGEKVISSTNTLSFYLPPGAAEGFEMLFDGESDESPDWDIAGDVIVRVFAKKNEEWRRKDAGLYRREILGVDEALLGFEKNVTHLDGRTVTIARSGTTQPGHVDVLKGEGVSILAPLISQQLETLIVPIYRCLHISIFHSEICMSNIRS